MRHEHASQFHARNRRRIDEKIPGVHIAFGHPYAEHTGTDWVSSTHIDVVGTKFDIWIDDRKIMAEGRFLLLGES